MKTQLAAFGFDMEGMPLEGLERSVVRDGLTWLKAIEREMLKPAPNPKSLSMLSASFFGVVKFCQFSVTIATPERLGSLVRAVELLGDVEAMHSRLAKLAAGGGALRKSSSPQKSQEPEELHPVGDPSALKKPQTAFFMFMGDHRETIVRSMEPGAKATDVMRRCSEIWKEMTEAEREPYEERYRMHKEEYDLEQAALKAKRAASLEAADPLVQRQYRNFACEMEVVPKGSAAWLMVHEYVRNAQLGGAPTGRQLRVARVVALNRQGEESRFAKHQEARDANRMLLWYGAPLAGWAALLALGLRLPPSEAPSSGRSFGRGLYFTDLAGVAAERCGPEVEGTKLLLLAEVSLGSTPQEAVCADPKADKQAGRCSAVLGRGELAPDPTGLRVLPDGLRVPLGKAVRRHVRGGDLPHNEYVLYNPAQARLRYAVEVREVSDAEAASLDAEATAAHTAMPRRLRAKTRAPWERGREQRAC